MKTNKQNPNNSTPTNNKNHNTQQTQHKKHQLKNQINKPSTKTFYIFWSYYYVGFADCSLKLSHLGLHYSASKAY